MKEFSAQVVPNKLSDRVLRAMQLIPSKGELVAHFFIIGSKDEALDQFGDQSPQYVRHRMMQVRSSR